VNGLINQVTDVWLGGWVSPSIKKIAIFSTLFSSRFLDFLKTLSLPVLITAVTSPLVTAALVVPVQKPPVMGVFEPAVIVYREVV
jgi:hypothetical protein